MNHDIHNTGGIYANVDTVIAGLSVRQYNAIVLFVLEARRLGEVAYELDMTPLEAAVQLNSALQEMVRGFHELGIYISPSELVTLLENQQKDYIPSSLVERILACCHEFVASVSRC